MLRIWLDLVDARTGKQTHLEVMEIANDGTGTPEAGNYRMSRSRFVPGKHGSPARLEPVLRGRLEGVPRDGRPWRLVARALEAMGDGCPREKEEGLNMMSKEMADLLVCLDDALNAAEERYWAGVESQLRPVMEDALRLADKAHALAAEITCRTGARTGMIHLWLENHPAEPAAPAPAAPMPDPPATPEAGGGE